MGYPPHVHSKIAILTVRTMTPLQRTLLGVALLILLLAGSIWFTVLTRPVTQSIIVQPTLITPTEPVKPTAQPVAHVIQPVTSTTPQYVMLAFDGSRSLAMWENTMAFADRLSLKTQFPVRFTYFISGVYYLTNAERTNYTSPHNPPGKSLIGFGTTPEEVAQRKALTLKAQGKGHEIGSHANGHFNGAPWTEAEWYNEFNQFKTFTEGWIDPKTITGFRAPNLGTNNAMYDFLPAFGFIYDTSATSAKMDAWPTKNGNNFWQFFLPSISRGNGKRILAMDYNFFVANSGGTDLIKRNDPRWQEFHDEMLTAYRNYFMHNYQGNRAPVYIGHHFSLWNDDLYYEVFKDFASEVCILPNVHCTTYSELVNYLDAR